MQIEAIPYSIMLGIAGIWLISMGLWLTLGINRSWWQWRILPFQEGYFWGGIPAGISMLFLAIAILLPLQSRIQGVFFWGGVFIFFIAIIFSFGPPWFLKPKWLRDLEKRYPTRHDIKYLREQARRLDTPTWLKIVYNPDRLQQWADDEIRQQVNRETAEVRRKHGR